MSNLTSFFRRKAAEASLAERWIAHDKNGLAPKPAESRREQRFPSNDQALMQIVSPRRDGFWDVKVLDVSRHGMQLGVAKFLTPGTIVKVRLNEAFVRGQVRYCVPVRDSFYAG